MDRKRLPIGIDSFREIREIHEGRYYYYVDKTDLAARMIDEAKHNFLSRPRRFGKSLFVDTLKNLFEGNKELFEGLAIHDKWNWKVKYPVLRFRFTKGTFKIPGYLERNIAEQLSALEQEWEMESDIPDAPDRLARLINRLVKKEKQRVVILVDEYDKPIYDAMDMIETEDVARANREILRGFYGTIKEHNDDIRFSFLTGVTKFSRAGIFSGINNLRDITLSPDFSSICGYTDHDIDTVFAPELEVIHPDFGKLDREEIKEWYNGYNWCGKEKIYNPFSILMLFVERKFGSWWYDTGTPTFLFNELKKRGATDTLRFAGMPAGNDLLSSFEIGNIGIPALLFQSVTYQKTWPPAARHPCCRTPNHRLTACLLIRTPPIGGGRPYRPRVTTCTSFMLPPTIGSAGRRLSRMPRPQSIVNRRRPAPFVDKSLTITGEKMSGGDTRYQLDFPNREVRQSLHQGLLRDIQPAIAAALDPIKLREALLTRDLGSVEEQLHAVLAGIPGPGQWVTYQRTWPAAAAWGGGRQCHWNCVGSPKLVPATDSVDEAHYASLVYLCFMTTGLVVRPEDPTSKGRIDTTVETSAAIYLFEFKVLGEKVKPGDALQQIRDKKYADKYRTRGVPVYLVGIEFDSGERNIERFDIAEA